MTHDPHDPSKGRWCPCIYCDRLYWLNRGDLRTVALIDAVIGRAIR